MTNWELTREAIVEEQAYEHSRCRTIRPGTLGYQSCRLDAGHKGEHRSQDGLSWAAPCETCCGSGMVAIGPWGSRPPRVACPDCNGSGLAPSPESTVTGREDE